MMKMDKENKLGGKADKKQKECIKWERQEIHSELKREQENRNSAADCTRS